MGRWLFTATGGFDGAREQGSYPASVACNPALLHLANAKNVLLLQGPVGPFFDRLTRWLHQQGATAHRIAFHPGDRLDCETLSPICYQGSLEDWPDYLGRLVADLKIDTVVLFGQSRKHHAAAIRLAKEIGLATIVLEEGYVRPGFVTMEHGGVNASSRTLDHYCWDPSANGPTVRTEKPPTTRGQFAQMAVYACRHYWHQHWQTPLSKNYSHHRPTGVWYHTRYWIWSWTRKYLHLAKDNATVRALCHRPFYFVPLQHEGDSQITHHSPYPEITSFITEVLRSFAAHAPADSLLVFKVHPHSRGGPRYDHQIRTESIVLGVADRVLHLLEGHTPTLVEHAQGVVLINSTVGLQALARCKPLAVLGEAIYRRAGLHFDGPLHEFWRKGTPPQAQDARDFLQQLIGLTQVPCNVYGRPDEPLLWKIETKRP